MTYQDGYQIGEHKRGHDDYDARFDFADATIAGTFDEFKRGFDDGFHGREATP